MQFSIIVPSFNYADYLQGCLDSVFGQTLQDFEVILVDDGSTDHTKMAVSHYLQQYPEQFCYLYQTNSGPAIARNRGLKEARGDYLIFLDADDVLVPDALEIFARAFKSSNADLVIARHAVVSADGKRQESHFNQISVDKARNFLAYIRKEISLAQGAYAVKKQMLGEIVFPQDLRGREDIVFFALILANLSAVAISDVTTLIYKHQDSLRHQLPVVEKTLLLSSILFEHPQLPIQLRKYRKEFESRLYLSIFRQLYKAKEYKTAIKLYLTAIKIFPKNIFLWRYLKRFILACFHF